MKQPSNLRRSAFFGLVVLATCLWLYILATRNDDSRLQHHSRYATQHLLTLNLLKRKHHFVAADETDISYGGRWDHGIGNVSSTRDSGSYVGVSVTNTTSLYIAAHTRHMLQRSDNHDGANPRSSPKTTDANTTQRQLPTGELNVEVSGRSQRRFRLDQRLFRIASGLNRNETYQVRIAFRWTSEQQGCIIAHFEGFWLERGGIIVPQKQRSAYVEAVTTTRADGLGSFPALLASNFNLSYSVIDVSQKSLRRANQQSDNDLRSTYFGVGPLRAPKVHFAQRYYRPRPSVILLELGSTDIQGLISRKLSDRALAQALKDLVNDYSSFVKSLRGTAHEYPTAVGPLGQIPGIDTSLAYNSERSNLPIFLLSPFTSSRAVLEISGHVLSRVVQEVRTEGDLSTIWVDTSGWLSEEDFMEAEGTRDTGLTAVAHHRVADILSQHLCPFLEKRNVCNFHRPSRYDGTLYLPDEASVGKLLEERKLHLIKQGLQLPTMA